MRAFRAVSRVIGIAVLSQTVLARAGDLSAAKAPALLNQTAFQPNRRTQ